MRGIDLNTTSLRGTGERCFDQMSARMKHAGGRISVPMLVDRSLPFHPLVHEALKGAGTWRSEDT
jgi:hypothetical protein